MTTASRQPRIGCLHGHHSNIPLLDGLFPPGVVEWVHFVDPGLLRRTAADPGFPLAQQRHRVGGELEWIAEAGCDAVVVTCTAYAALAPATVGPDDAPVVTVDGPLFAGLADRPGSAALVFTNPGTVEPTMVRLAAAIGDSAAGIEPVLIPDAFDLVMAGRTSEYEDRVAAGLRDVVRRRRFSTVAAAQLSMTPAARRVRADDGLAVLDPLAALAERLTALVGTRAEAS